MNYFEKNIKLYQKLLVRKDYKENIWMQKRFKNQILYNQRIVNLLKNNRMSLSKFNKLYDSDKWELVKILKNVTWLCKNCTIFQIPERMPEGERYCSNCDSLLTRRTGGGMGDPFNYIFKTKNEI